jgi:hypothetical protein
MGAYNTQLNGDKEMTQTQLLAQQVIKSGKVKEVKAHLERKLKPVSVNEQFNEFFGVKR